MPLFGLGLQSRTRAITPAYMQNFYVEPRPVGEKSQIVAFGMAGRDEFLDAGDTPWRGLLQVETTDSFFGVHRGTLYEIANNGTRTARGTLNTTSGRVDMSHNGTVILIVDGTDCYTYTIASTTFAEVVDPDFPAGAKTCTWLDQWFLVENGTLYAISEDGVSWDAANRGVPESSPDGIVRIITDHGEVPILGAITTEFHTNTGATDFPFAPLKSSTAEWGCAAPWSVCKSNDSLIFLGKNNDGQVSVVRLRGYVPEVISTPDLDKILAGYATVNDATALAYKEGGHPFYQLNLPSADRSWLYDALTGLWYPRKSAGIGRQRDEIAIQYESRTIVSDYANGKLYEVSPTTYDEDGETIEGEIVSGAVALPDKQRFPVDRLRVDMETGVGLVSGQGSVPQIMLQVSRDGGHTWGSELWASMGQIGQYKQRVEWRRLGTSDQWAFKLRITDPVKRAIVAATINPED